MPTLSTRPISFFDRPLFWVFKPPQGIEPTKKNIKLHVEKVAPGFITKRSVKEMFLLLFSSFFLIGNLKFKWIDWFDDDCC